ncbi:hypothetical protein PFISCL1PPCAC_17570, partial [Pristionchus fissidentatus]
CIACLSAAMSQSAGEASPVSDSFIPDSSLTFLTASSISVYALFSTMPTTILTNCLTLLIYLGSAAIVVRLLASLTSTHPLASNTYAEASFKEKGIAFLTASPVSRARADAPRARIRGRPGFATRAAV